jgi:hypothetical protein
MLAAPAIAADLKDPLSPLTATKGSMLCFGRDYSPEHLAQHPKQTTKSILLAFQFYKEQDPQRHVTIVLTPRTGGVPRQLPAYCLWWEKTAGIDTSGRKMFPTFNKPTAFFCMNAAGNTDEEGGGLVIDPAPDAKSLTVYLQSFMSVADGKQGQAKPYFVTLGPEDVIFALTRLDPKACEPFRR